MQIGSGGKKTSIVISLVDGLKTHVHLQREGAQ